MKTEIKEIAAQLEVGARQVIWKKCFREEVCVNIPFDGKKCLSASGCVGILLEGGTYLLEIELFGTRKTFPLLDQCITGFSVGIASLKVCVTNLRFENGNLRSLRLTARLCIGASIGPIHLEKCWDVVGIDIQFFTRTDFAKHSGFAHAALADAFETAALANASYVYLESEDAAACRCHAE